MKNKYSVACDFSQVTNFGEFPGYNDLIQKGENVHFLSLRGKRK